MVTSFDIYWLTRLDAICTFFWISFVFILCAEIVVIVASGIRWDCYDSLIAEKVFKAACKWMTAICFSILFILVFIPTTKEAVAIYLIPKIANNEQVQEIPENAAKLLNMKLQEWLKQFEEKK